MPNPANPPLNFSESIKLSILPSKSLLGPPLRLLCVLSRPPAYPFPLPHDQMAPGWSPDQRLSLHQFAYKSSSDHPQQVVLPEYIIQSAEEHRDDAEIFSPKT